MQIKEAYFFRNVEVGIQANTFYLESRRKNEQIPGINIWTLLRKTIWIVVEARACSKQDAVPLATLILHSTRGVQLWSLASISFVEPTLTTGYRGFPRVPHNLKDSKVALLECCPSSQRCIGVNQAVHRASAVRRGEPALYRRQSSWPCWTANFRDLGHVTWVVKCHVAPQLRARQLVC
jgi:hypothetical protein